jgi:alkylglycerol monooxygenase
VTDCAATAGGFNFLTVSVYNMVNHGLPRQANSTFWLGMLPLSTLTGKLNDGLLANLPSDSSGVDEIAPLPFFKEAVPFFLVSVALEVVLTLLRGKSWYNYQDTISSLSAGLLNQTAGAILRYAAIFPYTYIHEHYKVADLSEHRILLWVITFVGIDLGYYWFHRYAHEISFLWGFHEIHHSSEEYNLSTALRQTIYAGLDGFVFYLPLAPFVPVDISNTHKAFNLLFQFWIHTRHIPKLPWPIELIFNTPSHHRVHHGRNPWCVDCNYGGTLIVWDRLFGTFHEEDETDPITYGIIPPLVDWDPLEAQAHHHIDMAKRMVKSPLTQAWKYIVSGPGWIFVTPRKPGADGDVPAPYWKSLPIPEIGHKFNPTKTPVRSLPPAIIAFSALSFVVVAVSFFAFTAVPLSKRDWVETALYVAYMAWTVWDMGALHSRWMVSVPLEFVRCLATSVGLVLLWHWSGPLPSTSTEFMDGLEVALASFEASSRLAQLAIVVHAAMAMVSLMVLPCIISPRPDELARWKAEDEAFQALNAQTFAERTSAESKKHR